MSTTLDDTAEQFQPKPKHTKLLAENKMAVLRLRSKGATYAQIEELLRQNDIIVSEASIIRFCRRHASDIKRESTRSESDAPHADSVPVSAFVLDAIQNPKLARTSVNARDYFLPSNVLRQIFNE